MVVIAPTRSMVFVVEAAKTAAKYPAPGSFEGIATATAVIVSAAAAVVAVVLLVVVMRGAWRVPPSEV
jgi:hypothetical protein